MLGGWFKIGAIIGAAAAAGVGYWLWQKVPPQPEVGFLQTPDPGGGDEPERQPLEDLGQAIYFCADLWQRKKESDPFNLPPLKEKSPLPKRWGDVEEIRLHWENSPHAFLSDITLQNVYEYFAYMYRGLDLCEEGQTINFNENMCHHLKDVISRYLELLEIKDFFRRMNPTKIFMREINTRLGFGIGCFAQQLIENRQDLNPIGEDFLRELREQLCQ